MAGHDPTIRLPEFWGEASEDPEKNLFICEKIWEAKKITDEDTKLTQLAITLRDHTLDWYMSLDVNSPQGVPKTIADVKKLLVNEFQKPNSEDQYMNEMIEIRKKPGESVWEIDQRFKRLKGKLKYAITDMQHRHLFVNSLVTTLEIPIKTTEVPNSGRGSAGSLTTGREPVSEDRSNNRGVEGGFEESNIST
jgi:hypothetical protein